MSDAGPTEANNAIFFIGNIKLIFLTGHVRLAVPFVLGKVYDLVEALYDASPSVPSGLALRDGTTSAYRGWVKATRDLPNSLERVRAGLQFAGVEDYIARVKVTRVGSLFETVDRHGVKQVGVHGDAVCWVDAVSFDDSSESTLG